MGAEILHTYRITCDRKDACYAESPTTVDYAAVGFAIVVDELTPLGWRFESHTEEFVTGPTPEDFGGKYPTPGVPAIAVRRECTVYDDVVCPACVEKEFFDGPE